MRARLNIMSAANVPAKAGSGRMNTMRTAHTNCVLKQRDPCGGWPHSNDTTIQTTIRKCGDRSDTPTIRLPALMFRQDRKAAHAAPQNAKTIRQRSSKIQRMQALYEGLITHSSQVTA